jgi:hypothetical protein
MKYLILVPPNAFSVFPWTGNYQRGPIFCIHYPWVERGGMATLGGQIQLILPDAIALLYMCILDFNIHPSYQSETMCLGKSHQT